MSSCSDFRRANRNRVTRVTGESTELSENEKIHTIDLYVYSDIAQVVEFDQNVCFNVVSAKSGNICFSCRSAEIRVSGTYHIEFACEDSENIPLALTVNGGVVSGVVYKNPSELCIGEIILDLKRGDKLALTNKFSLNNIVMPENIINTFRLANASLSIFRL